MSAIEFEGQIGPPGPQGEKGDKGDQGDQGDQGEVGTVWTPTLNLPLTSVADWAMPAGWTNDGAKMIAGTGASQIRNKYANRVPQDCFLTSLEIQVPGSSRSAADLRAGIQLDWDGANTGSATYLLKWVNLASGSAYNERDAVAAGVTVAVPGGLALDTWHQLRVLRAGMAASMFVNGVYIATSRLDSHAGGQVEHSFIGLHAYNIDAWFRNLKMWRLAQP